MLCGAASPQVDPVLSSSSGRQGMGKVIFEGQVITESRVGTGRWELRCSEAVNFGLFCPLWNQMAEHPDGFITDRPDQRLAGVR